MNAILSMDVNAFIPSIAGMLKSRMILIFVAFYFLLIAPQRKKQKQHQKMINALEKGDNVKTIGGVFGKVTGVKDDRVVVQIAENVKVEVTF